MKKSNLNLQKAISVLEKWQRGEDSHKLVHVVDFIFRPQSTQFMLCLDIYIAGISESYLDGRTEYFYGSFLDCINQAVDKIEEIREDMRKRI